MAKVFCNIKITRNKHQHGTTWRQLNTSANIDRNIGTISKKYRLLILKNWLYQQANIHYRYTFTRA